MSDEIRFVLVKPGDVLLIGNVGPLQPAKLDAFDAFRKLAGVEVALFEADIDIDVKVGSDD